MTNSIHDNKATYDNRTTKYKFILGYARYISDGLARELIDEIAEKEGKSIREVLREMGMSTGTPYKPLGEEAKRKILEKALEVLLPDEVLLEVFYDIRSIYARIIRDIFEVVGDDARREIITEYKNIGIEKVSNIKDWLENNSFTKITVHENSELPSQILMNSYRNEKMILRIMQFKMITNSAEIANRYRSLQLQHSKSEYAR
ncbi:hypothetical protein [Sulfurisphaera ohwakuensis]|uniref:hypothetical protein n=1 Tax=Sulfurisphaera ohwakuensis TaxID=69656 RepID=UPI0036F3091B